MSNEQRQGRGEPGYLTPSDWAEIKRIITEIIVRYHRRPTRQPRSPIFAESSHGPSYPPTRSMT